MLLAIAVAFAFASCSADVLADNIARVAGGLSGTGINVFTGSRGSAQSSSGSAEKSVDFVLESYGSQAKQERFNAAEEQIQEAVNQMRAGSTSDTVHNIEAIKPLIVQLLDSITLDGEVMDSLLFDISKASVNESSKDALRKKLANVEIAEGSPAYEIYYSAMNIVKELLEMMNNGRASASPYALWLDNGSAKAEMDFSPVFEEVAPPTIADVVVMSIMSEAMRNLLDFTQMSDIKISDAAGLIYGAVDVLIVADTLGGEDESEYRGFVGIVQIMMDKLKVKGVLGL
ncbi:MAG TPA: hypothetical protein DCO86_04700 [Spirochaetaceae bacterium]|nr:hypothetical protein [Spirochaetaceae bacterium]